MGDSETRSFGQFLREAREKAGLDTGAIADTTRIQKRYLEALEAEDWSSVPEGVIGRGFVRVVAREIGVDPKEALALYREARGEEQGAPEHSLPEAEWKVRLRGERSGPPLLLVFLLLAGTGLGVWLWSPWSVERPTGGEPASVPEATPAPVEALEPPPEESPVPDESVVGESAEMTAAEEDLEPIQQDLEEPVPEEPGVAAEAPPETEAVAAVPQEPTSHRLEVQAVEKVWVRVKPDGGRAQDSILGPGDSRVYEADESLLLKLGNAGGVRLWWDGEALRVPGSPGQVLSLTFPEAAGTLRP